MVTPEQASKLEELVTIIDSAYYDLQKLVAETSNVEDSKQDSTKIDLAGESIRIGLTELREFF